MTAISMNMNSAIICCAAMCAGICSGADLSSSETGGFLD
jgi:hypothetical protein